jgi:hypothetical protein
VKNHDLTDLLRSWSYQPGKINARKIEGIDGREKLQVRIELGTLQMEILGRPDGERPHGHESLLHHHRERLRRYIQQAGNEIGFVLSSDECRALREEAVQYYHRYVARFSLGDFEGVVADTIRNLEVFDLCNDFGATEEDRSVLEQIRPSVIMMRTRGEAELAMSLEHPKQALASIDRGLSEIKDAFDDADASDRYDTSNEVQLLRGMRELLIPKLPSSQRAELLERLKAALDAENYELAAILRDELRMMKD